MAKDKDKNSQIEQLRGQLQRALADYANLAKRVEEEKKEVVKFANASLFTKFLEILDSLEAAQKILNSNDLEPVIAKFRSVLAEEGLKEINPLGEPFDPAKEEALEIVEGAEDNKVVEVFAKGYEIDGRLIRAARVRVSKRAETFSEQEPAEK